MNPEISIIVPVYHVEAYLRGCLDSILAQSFTNFELILVNDGGSEEETAICLEYAAKDSRIVYLYQENRGLSAARNYGLQYCHGDWIMFVDSDDRVHEQFCEASLKAAKEYGADLVIFDLAYVTTDGTITEIHTSETPEGVMKGIDALILRMKGKTAGYVWNKIYRANLWKGIEFPVGELWEDDAVLHEVLDRVTFAYILHEVLYYKTGRIGSITEDAGRNNQVEYWCYHQKKKRYYYLQEHHPDLMHEFKDNIQAAAFRYGTVCALITKDQEGFREARAWMKKEKLWKSSGIPTHDLVCWSMCFCYPLFVLLGWFWLKMNRRL